MSVIPQSYEDWTQCITVDCGIPLTAAFVSGRIAALQDPKDASTQKFIERWGEAHHAQTLAWFQRAASELG